MVDPLGTFWRSVRSEWLKTRRSNVGWLAAGGGLFTPLMVLIGRIKNRGELPRVAEQPLEFWTGFWNQSWQGATILVLPLSAILLVTVVTQIEIRANGWKQVEATPAPRWAIFLAKLTVIIVMFLIMLVWFDLGLLGAAFGSSLVGAPRPPASVPLGLFLERTGILFVDTLPLLALQYLIALRSTSFLAPLGIGTAIWIGSVSTLSWEQGYLFPYAYAAIEHPALVDPGASVHAPIAVPALATLVFLAAAGAGYVAYRLMSDRG
jgi:hypothetical protein